MGNMWKYELYYENQFLHDSDFDYESEEEALEEAQTDIESYIEGYKAEGCYEEGDEENFTVKTIFKEESEE